VPSYPARFNYQARLTDSGGAPLSGLHTLYFSLYAGGDANTSASGVLQSSEFAVLNIEGGIVNHTVGTGTGATVNDTMFRTGGNLFLLVAVDTPANVVLPRTLLQPAPYSIF